MNRSVSLLLFAFFILIGPISQALPWVERHGLSGANWQTEFDLWTAPPYNYRPTRVCGSETSGQARYVGMLEKSSKTTQWAATHGADATTFTTTHNNLHADGFRLVWLDGFGVGGTAYYNGIWERRAEPPNGLPWDNRSSRITPTTM